MKTKITLIATAVALLAAVSITAAVAGPSKASRASVGVSQSAFGTPEISVKMSKHSRTFSSPGRAGRKSR